MARILDIEVELPVATIGGRIKSISVNGSEQPIVDGNVDIPVPTKTSDLNNDSNFVKNEELAPVAKSGDYNDLENTPYIPSTEGLASEEYVDESISSHNSSPESHQDIRDSIPSTEGLASETYVGNAISEHDTSSQSHQDIRTALAVINSKIPEQASESNQLADKNFVNSSVATNTGYFLATLDIIEDLHLTYDATMSQILSALEAYEFASEKTNNDYCNVITQDSVGNTLFMRFKWNGKEDTFKYEFSLNNSSFTAVQWAAINSNATAENIAQIALNALAITTLQSDVAGKVSKSGDTMTGELTFDTITKGIILKSNDNTKAFRIASTGNYFSIDLVQNYDTDTPSYLRVFGFPTSSLIAEMVNGLYLGRRTAENKAAKISDVDNKLANYLPLAGGTITGDVTFQGQPNTQQYIKFLKNDTSLHCFAIRNPYGGGQIDIGRLVRSTGVYVEGIRLGYRSAVSKVTLNILGGLLYGGDTNDENTRYQMRSDIYKQGIVSQTQTWTQASDGSYSYVMTNPITGNIPISFIDKWNILGSKYASSAYSHTFNETTGYFELNGLTDISYEEAILIAEESQPLSAAQMPTYRKSRTNFAGTIASATATRQWQSSNSEVAWGGAITWNGNNLSTHIALSDHLKKIINFVGNYFTGYYNITDCPSLETITFRSKSAGFKVNVSITGCSHFTLEGVKNMVDYATNTSAITFTFDTAVYQRCQADTTEYTYSGNTYVGIIAYAAVRNITIQSA